MFKTITFLGALLLVPVVANAQECHNVANAAVSQSYNQQSVVTHTITTSVPVQVVSPQVVQVAPEAVVTQNVYNQQVVGAANVSHGYVQSTVVSQPNVVIQPQVQVIQQPYVVQQYNAGLANFQGTQNYVRVQGANVVVQHYHGLNNAAVNVNVQHAHNNVQRANNVGLLNRVFGSKTVTKTKTVTKSR